MSDCNDNNEKISAAFPGKLAENVPTGLQINECAMMSVFDINSLLGAARNYVRLNQSINMMLGMEVRWFRAVPQQRSKDVIFQEYTLSNVADDPLCIKVMLVDGNFPDSKYNYDLMGLEYDIPLEVQLDKEYWELIAGRGTAPQKKDIVYFPIPNKLYQVESSFLSRGFMEQETTWRINLRKYSPEMSRREGESLKNTIDQYTVSEEEIFGDDMNRDINKIVNDRQNSPYNSTSMDKYKIMDDALDVIVQDIDVYGVRVATSHYDLSTSDSSVAVRYPIEDNVTIADDRSISMWLKIDDNKNKEYSVTILESAVSLGANYRLTGLDGSFSAGDVINIYRQGSLNLYATYVQKESTWHAVRIEPVVAEHLSSMRSDWYNFKNFKARREVPVNMLTATSSSGDTVMSVDLISGQYLSFYRSGQTHIAVMSDKIDVGTWHGMVVNMGNVWNQFNVYVWKKHETDSVGKLTNIFYDTMRIDASEMKSSEYSIKRSLAGVANVRLYNATIEEEKQSNELLSYFIKDGDSAIINDACDPKYRSPYIGKQR